MQIFQGSFPKLKSVTMVIEKFHSLFPIAFLFLIFQPTCLAATTIKNITTDQYALLSFKNHITPETYNRVLSENWSVSASVCEWIGVTCGSRHQRVTALNVSFMGLSGTIPPRLGNLSFLVSLDLTGNYFHGELPHELVHLKRLRFLNVSKNNLTGEIPPWVGSLNQLRFLYLWSNLFTGSIPTSISNLSNLEELVLSFNSLDGSIPAGIGGLANLKSIELESAQISGSFPLELLNVSSLETIALTNNSLSGSLPTFMCSRLPKLKTFALSFNNFSGKIPSDLFQCTQLQILYLSDNKFSGFIPKEIGNLKSLERLYLSNNNLEGEIPREIGNLTMLTILVMSGCSLAGLIPKEFGNLQNLEQFFLGANRLSGTIPDEIFNISSMIVLSLCNNRLSGNLPSNMCQRLPNLDKIFLMSNELDGALPNSVTNCSNLRMLELDANRFTGYIPISFGNLRLLEWLSLGFNFFTSNSPSLGLDFIASLTGCKHLRLFQISYNPLNDHLPDSGWNLSSSLKIFVAHSCNITGTIPWGFGNLSSLIHLGLRGNQLTGAIPATFKDLRQLQFLNLEINELSRARLDELCGLQELGLLSLSQNHILESIPECLGNVTSLRYLNLGSNRLTSIIPAKLFNLRDLLELNLSKNGLSGFLPLEIGNLNEVTLLDFSSNNLSNRIPSTIGGLQRVTYFSLAFNKFDGSIPESTGQMISLVELDLQHNNLTGTVPMTLETLRYLQSFSVAFNHLSGEIPSRGPFENFTSESFISNEALCGAQRFHVPACPKTTAHKIRSKRKSEILFLSVGWAAVVVAIAFAFIYVRCLKKDKALAQSALAQSSAAIPERFSCHDLENATDGFNESNLLGKGSFGSVYRGNMADGRTVAIKVFNPEVQGAFKTFDRECEVFRSLRHRNLTKVISSCSNPDFKALILEFMANGSLEKWLYSHNYCLDIMQRLNMMIDVACALEYLHTGQSTPVVHCDLKPSNILLDQDMVAHVSDFGITKFLSPEDSFTYTDMIATFGYVAPEYGLEGLVSPKCDVYSYGIVMMEVFTRTKPSHEMFGGSLNLRSWVNDSMRGGLVGVIDGNCLSTDEEYYNEKMECLHSVMEVALNCTRESPRERSNIVDVLAALRKMKLKLIKFHHG